MKIVVLLLLLVSCNHTKVTESTSLSVDSTYLYATAKQFDISDINESVKLSVVVEKMVPDTTTGDMRVKEAKRITVTKERQVEETSVSGDTTLCLAQSTTQDNVFKEDRSEHKRDPPFELYIFIGILVVIFFLKKL